MNAYKLAATLMEDGTLVLKGLPFHAGDTVEIIILEQPQEKPTFPPNKPSILFRANNLIAMMIRLNLPYLLKMGKQSRQQ
jgi:hypothetical protein